MILTKLLNQAIIWRTILGDISKTARQVPQCHFGSNKVFISLFSCSLSIIFRCKILCYNVIYIFYCTFVLFLIGVDQQKRFFQKPLAKTLTLLAVS